MKKIMNFLLMAATVCGISLAAASCSSNDDNPATPDLNLSEKIIGKWMQAEIDGQPALTNEKSVYTFVSPTKAIANASKCDYTESGSKWIIDLEYDVVIDGNKMTLTAHPDEVITLIKELTITSINDNELVCKFKHTTMRNGQVINTSGDEHRRYAKLTVNYKEAILGTWQGHCTSEGSVFDDGQEHRWQYNADGTFVYYVKDGDSWVPSDNSLNEYFVDGTLLCTRWIDNGVENREWWEINIADGKMNWTALRQNEDGTTFTATFEMTKVVE